MEELSTKSSILQHIFEAKNAHKSWVRKADMLVSGLNGYQGKKVDFKVDKSFIPLDSSMCEFGQWFNRHSKHLATLPSIGAFIHRIEEHHTQLHAIYADIYTIFFVTPQNRPLIHKVLTINSKKVSAKEREKAKIHLNYLKRSSRELLEVLQVLEEKVRALEYAELRTAIKTAV